MDADNCCEYSSSLTIVQNDKVSLSDVFIFRIERNTTPTLLIQLASYLGRTHIAKLATGC